MEMDKPELEIHLEDKFKGDYNLAQFEEIITAVSKKYAVDSAVISLIIVDDQEIQKINKEFLGKDNPTDCISFDLTEQGDHGRVFDIIVNAEMAQRQAKKRNQLVEAELALYITHGLLHNLGFDDSDETRARQMHEMEDEILTQFGYGSVYYTEPKE